MKTGKSKKNGKTKRAGKALKRIEKMVEPSMRYSDGYGVSAYGTKYSSNPTIGTVDGIQEELYSDKWVFQKRHYYHLYALVARGLCPAEIVEEFILSYFDMPEIMRIGYAKASECRDKQVELETMLTMLKDALHSCIQSKLEEQDQDSETIYQDSKIIALKKKIDELQKEKSAIGNVSPGEYLKTLIDWLRRKVYYCTEGRNRKKWEQWIARENHAWKTSDRAIPIRIQDNRLALYQRMLDKEAGKEFPNLSGIAALGKLIYQEIEGNKITLDINYKELVMHLLEGGTRADTEFRQLKKELESRLPNGFDSTLLDDWISSVRSGREKIGSTEES